ncbi:hypothetical protein ABPG72_017824 [Tetrahymena utriculariae]
MKQNPSWKSIGLQQSFNDGQEDNFEYKSFQDKNDFFDDTSNIQLKSQTQVKSAQNQSENRSILNGNNQSTKGNTNKLLCDNIIISFDHVLSDIGIGPYQYLFYAVMATLGLTEGAQVSVFTIMIPLLKNQWDVQDDANSLQVCLVFLGFLVGSVLSGQFADRYGRKKPFIYSSLLTVVFTMLQAITTNIIQMTVLRFLCAILVGFFGPLGVTLLAEVTPLAVRGRFMSLITVSFSLGQLYGQFIGYFTLEGLDKGNWRALIVWTGLPGLLAWIIGYLYLDESARFDIIDGRFEEAFKIINKMNRMNGDRLNTTEISESTKNHLKTWSREVNRSLHQQKGSLASLFKGDGKLITPLVWFNWFTLSFMYYGILVLMPKMMDEIMKLTHKQKDPNDANDMVKLALSTFTEMISASIASFLIEIKGLGRKNSMIICYILQAIACLMVYIDGMDHFVLWASVCKFFLTMTFIFSYQFTAEVYSTKIRTTGVGMANGIGRSGGSLMPWISFYLQKINLFAPFLLFSCLSLLTALVDFILPYDTLGRDLDIADDDDEQEPNLAKKK